MFLSRNKKINVYPCKPQFYYIEVGFKGVQIIQACFCDGLLQKVGARLSMSVVGLIVALLIIFFCSGCRPVLSSQLCISTVRLNICG